MNAIKAVEGKQMLAKFPLNYDIMMPVSRDYLEIWFEHMNILIFSILTFTLSEGIRKLLK